MIKSTVSIKDYGWKDSQAACAHEYLTPQIINILMELHANSILDLGCGNGALAHKLGNRGFSVIGCDADKNGIKIANTIGDGNFKHLSVYDDPSTLGKRDFDIVTSIEVIEHLFIPRSLPRFAYEVLREGGHLIITTPYHGYIKNLVLSIFNKWDQHLDPLWDGGHIKIWSLKTLRKLLEEEGFEIKTFRGIGRLPYLWKSMLLVAQKK